MGLERKFTLSDLTLLDAVVERQEVIKKTGSYTLVQYRISYADYSIDAQVREYPNIQFVTKMNFLNTSENQDDLISKMLNHLYTVKEKKNNEIKGVLRDGHSLSSSFEDFINQNGIIAKLSWNKSFGNLCLLFIIGGIILSIIYGIIPFVFLGLAGIDGFILSKFWKRKILCG